MSKILTRMADGVLTRSDGVLENVDFRERIIDVIAVPWDQKARVFWRGDWWEEVFERGAFDRLATVQVSKIRVNREHRKGDTVGKIAAVDPAHEKGLFTRLKIVKGAKGDETLYLAAEDMISASIGFIANNIGRDVVVDKDAKTRLVRHAFLDHVAMVEDPAFEGAQVLAVRGDGASGIAVVEPPLPETPLLDEWMKDPVIAEIMRESRRAA